MLILRSFALFILIFLSMSCKITFDRASIDGGKLDDPHLADDSHEHEDPLLIKGKAMLQDKNLIDLPCVMKIPAWVTHTKKKDGHFSLICTNKICRARSAFRKYKADYEKAKKEGKFDNYFEDKEAWKKQDEEYNRRMALVMKEMVKEERKPRAFTDNEFHAPLNKPVEFKNVYFDFDSIALLPKSFFEIDSLISILKDRKKLNVYIIGHTDVIGDEVYNKTLSFNRAKSVTKYIISKGIKKKRIQAYSYGSTRPKYTNATKEGRARNRRVEFLLVKSTS